MKYIIDTHVLLWTMGDDQKLSDTSKEILQDKQHDIYISIMSFWEIAIKRSSGKLEMYISLSELWDFALDNDISILPVVYADVETIETLPFPKRNSIEHRDPFDRMIIAQSQTNDLQIISCDDKFDLYENVVRIW
mgnify:CR=1 FL=1